jgi:hypothetical protein
MGSRVAHSLRVRRVAHIRVPHLGDGFIVAKVGSALP